MFSFDLFGVSAAAMRMLDEVRNIQIMPLLRNIKTVKWVGNV